MASSRFRTVLALAIALTFSLSFLFLVLARSGTVYGGRHSSTYSPHTSASQTVSGSHHSLSSTSIKCESCPRDS
jgi:hypothetical protein